MISIHIMYLIIVWLIVSMKLRELRQIQCNKRRICMLASLSVPFEVMGIGIIVSYGIAFLIRVLLSCIRLFTNKQEENK